MIWIAGFSIFQAGFYKAAGKHLEGIVYSRGRGGYYLASRGNYTEIGWCGQSLCNDYNRKGLEIFNFPLEFDPRTLESARLKIHTFTPRTESWYSKVSFDVYINDVKIGSFHSAERGREKISEILIDNLLILKEGKNGIFIVYNEDRTGYGLLTRLDWIEMEVTFSDQPLSG